MAINYNSIAALLGNEAMTSVSVRILRGKVNLRGNVDGVRREFTTKYKVTDKDLAYVEKNKDKLFRELAYAKDTTLKTYSKKVYENTKVDRCNRWDQQVEKYVGMIADFFSDKEIGDIVTSDIKEFQAHLIALNYTPKTIKNIRGVLSMILRNAEGDGLTDKKGVVALVRPPKKGNKLVNFYNVDEIAKLIEAADTPQYKNLLKFNFFTGMRSGELCALQWRKIDFERNTILVDATIDSDQDLNTPKGDKIRLISMTPQAKEALLAQRKLTGLHEYVFLNQFNKPYVNGNCFNDKFKQVCEYAGVRKGIFYDTRHSFATLCKQLDLDDAKIEQQMGHYNIKVTKEHYLGILQIDNSAFKNIKVG